MSETVHVYDLALLERDLLGVETMRLTDTLINKVPLVDGNFVVYDHLRDKDGQASLAIIPHEAGVLEVVREDEAPISIEYFDPMEPRNPIQVLASPVQSLFFSPSEFQAIYRVREAKNVLHWIGLESFTRLVAGRAVKKQRQAGFSVKSSISLA